MANISETHDFDPRTPVGTVKLRYIQGQIDDEELEEQLEKALNGNLEMPHETPESDWHKGFR